MNRSTVITTHNVGGLQFRSMSPQSAAAWIAGMGDGESKAVHIHLANAYVVALANVSESYRLNFSGAAVNLPDGNPISVWSRLRRDPFPLRQIRGPQLFLDALSESQGQSVRHYLLGSTPEVLELIRARIERDNPGVQVVGFESPPFRQLTDEEILERNARIAKSGAHVVWVGLGTPKQDIVAREIAESCDIATVAVGAAFDYAAGSLKMAPQFMRSMGLEWAYRFAVEPRRLWRRYVFGNVQFLYFCLVRGRRAF